jgi:hypothetical protein
MEKAQRKTETELAELQKLLAKLSAELATLMTNTKKQMAN